MTYISVIIPAYNAESHIGNAIENIKKQSHRHFECIIVNDGSSDNTKGVVSSLVGEDKRFKVVNSKKNMGSAHARNVGLKVAKGEYIIFLDSDDEYDEELLDTAYRESAKSGSDVTIFDYYINDTQLNTRLKRNIDVEIKIPRNPFVISDIKKGAFNVFANALFNKVYKHSFLIENNLSFDNELRRAQDALFVTQSLVLANSITYINKYLYTYNLDVAGSAWQTISKYPDSGLVYLEKLFRFLQAKNSYETLRGSYENTFISNVDYVLSKLVNHNEQFIDVFKKAKSLIREYDITLRDQEYYIQGLGQQVAPVLINGTLEDYVLLKLKDQSELIGHLSGIISAKVDTLKDANKKIEEERSTNTRLRAEIGREKGIKESARLLYRAIKRRIHRNDQR